MVLDGAVPTKDVRNAVHTVPFVLDHFFEKSRITLDKWLYVTYLWSQGTKVNSVERQVQIGEKTVIQMFQYLRDVCSSKLLSTPEKTVIQMFQYLRDICSSKLLSTPVELGGPGVIAHIDETINQNTTEDDGPAKSSGFSV